MVAFQRVRSQSKTRQKRVYTISNSLLIKRELKLKKQKSEGIAALLVKSFLRPLLLN